jgi:Sec-independent protein secretion pathway component TatC
LLVLAPLVVLYYLGILFAFLVGPKPPPRETPTKAKEPVK